ncbi:hypothetical protein [Acinetobacter pseudolwoffii]|uniref:hypothetical protein n=1 Tax=Acinetobacter pseudolwoffii TaxID=2053287 RepID=UPI00209AEE2A|nr:hypothetical protein [Acinetobacter pseudolwoffii]MCO8091451.1 hypothetical protein [Acinetobacter pseudolwoffii]
MSDFEKYIEAKYPNRSPKILFQKFKDIDGTLFYGIKEVEDQAEAWNHQQAIIDDLKAQLNNMEACYIEKKKECEGLQGRINEALEDLEYPTAPWDETIASVVKVLRGGHETK